jgi:hypothetical protein
VSGPPTLAETSATLQATERPVNKDNSPDTSFDDAAPSSFAEWLADLDDEDLACAGLRRRPDKWSFKAMEREVAAAKEEAVGGPQEARTQPLTPKQRHIRRPSLESQVRQLLKAAHAAGVQIAVTVEGDKVTATPARGVAPAPTEKAAPVNTTAVADSDINEWDRDLGTLPPSLRQ